VATAKTSVTGERTISVSVKVTVRTLGPLPKSLEDFREMINGVSFAVYPTLRSFTSVQLSIATQLAIDLAVKLIQQSWGIERRDMAVRIDANDAKTGVIHILPSQVRAGKEDRVFVETFEC